MKRQTSQQISPSDSQSYINPISSFSEEELLSRQHKLFSLYKESTADHKAKLFVKVKYKQHIYEIGDFVHLYDPTEQSPYIARVSKIIQIPDNLEKFPFLEVELYLKKQQLPPSKQYNRYLPHFSVAQVFASGHHEFVYMQAIKTKCYVLTNKEYESLGGTSENIYFNRARLDQETLALHPGPKDWPTECVCKMPVNPDLEYIQCGRCQKWFHIQCVRAERKKLEDDDFICKGCKGVSGR